MIILLTCSCGSAEGLIRQALHKYGYKNWAMEPITQGKTKCLSVIEELIRKSPDDDNFRSLYSHINNNGKWCVILGYDTSGNSRWSDISKHDLKSDVEAEAIVEKFL